MKMLDNVREIRKKMSAVSFAPVLEYCHRKHDDTLGLLLEMESMIEENIDLFLMPGTRWIPRTTSSHDGNKNEFNPVIMKVDAGTVPSITRVWLDNGIHFHWNSTDEKVFFISHNIDMGGKLKDASDFCRYHFFDRNTPMGYESYFPTDKFFGEMENFFRENGTLVSSYIKLKQYVDEDWELALKAKKCLQEALELIEKGETQNYDSICKLIEDCKEKEVE